MALSETIRLSAQIVLPDSLVGLIHPTVLVAPNESLLLQGQYYCTWGFLAKLLYILYTANATSLDALERTG
jgi:hypothetical protein